MNEMMLDLFQFMLILLLNIHSILEEQMKLVMEKEKDLILIYHSHLELIIPSTSKHQPSSGHSSEL